MVAVAVAATAAALPVQRDGAVNVRDIVETVDISGLALSPDGKWIVYRTETADSDDNAYALEWFVIRSDGTGVPMKVADGGSAILTDAGQVGAERPSWSPDACTIYFRALFDGDVQIWRARTDRFAATQVTHDAGTIKSFTLTRDGKTLRYIAGASRQAVKTAMQQLYRDGTLVDASTDMAAPLAGGEIVDGQRRVQRFTGDYFDRGDLLWNAPRRQVELDLATGRQTTTELGQSPVLPTRSILLEETAANGDRVMIERGLTSASVTVVRKTGGRIICTLSPCTSRTLQTATWQSGSDALILDTRDANRRDSLFRWQVGTSVAQPIIASKGTLSGGRVGTQPCVITSEEAVCVEETATSPPRLVRAKLTGGSVTTLVDPNARLRARITVKARTLAWTDNDAHRFTGILLNSAATPPRSPMIIDYYACEGFLRGGVGTELPMLPLAAAGFAVLCVNETSFVGPQNALATYRAALSGIQQIVSQLAAEGTIDPAKVGMAGFSFGSEVTSWIAAHSNLLSVASLNSAQIEPAFLWANALPGRNVEQAYREVYGLGWPDRDPEAWKRMAPALSIEHLKIPVLIQLPEREARYSMEYYARALRANKPVELHVFPDEPHILAQPAHQLASYQRTFDWFRYWLSGITDPAPEKQAQYVRWRALSAPRSEAIDRTDP